MDKTLIIAEAGVNHNGDINIAKDLIKAAAAAGADYVKFQSFNAKEMILKDTQKANYQAQRDTIDDNQYEMLKRLEISNETLAELFHYANQESIKIFSTAFDLQSLTALESLGQNIFKIPSGEITNIFLMRHIAKLNKKTILSTGMSTIDEIEEAADFLLHNGLSKENLTLLHCTSAYPTPPSDVNLKAMQTLQKHFNTSVGYSDHTEGVEVATAAVAMGANIIEKHFTLDKNLPGPDHKASIEPLEFEQLVRNIRTVEAALGSSNKLITESEAENRTVARKSLVASKEIRPGEYFSYNNLTAKRPGNGKSPMLALKIIGTKATRMYRSDDLI